MKHVWKSRSFSLFAAVCNPHKTSCFRFQERDISKVTTSRVKNKEPSEDSNSFLLRLRKSNDKLYTEELFKTKLAPMQNDLKNHNWDKIIENGSKWWNIAIFHTMLMKYFLSTNDYHSAKAYLNHIKLQSIPNTMVLASYVAICGMNNQEKDMLDHYEQIPKQCYIDRDLSKLIIMGLVHTQQWEKALPMLKLQKQFLKTSNSSMWSLVATAAFQNGDLAKGINLLQELYEEKLSPSGTSILAWLEAISQATNKALKLEHLVRFFAVMTKYQERFSLRTIENLQTVMQWNFNFKSSLVEIKQSCKNCPICNKKLETLQITENQFKLLRAEMEKKLVMGEDIYRNSNPQEIRNFKKFLNKARPYNLVVDGLNVAYRRGARTEKSMSTQLLNALKYLRFNKKQEILLLGKKHLWKWPNDTLVQIQQLAQVYLTDNLSEDDPFLLLAAISGGPNTNFLSDDQMRDHSYKFQADESLQDLFNVWKKSHQVFFEIDNLKLKTKGPVILSDRCQGNLENGFHMPSVIDLPTFSQMWLCLKTNEKM